MRSKKPFLIALFLGVWLIITYVFLTRRDPYDAVLQPSYRELQRNLDRLEAEIKSEDVAHHELVQRLLVAMNEIQKFKKSMSLASASPNLLPASSSSSAAAVQRDPTTTVRQLDKPRQAATARPIQSPVGQPNGAPPPSAEILLETTLHTSGLDNLSAILENAQRDQSFKGPVIPILVFACNRVSVRKCLDNLIEFRPNINQFPIIVSQDCDDEATRNVIRSYKDITLISQPDQSDIAVPPKEKKFKGYYKIARHYGWALNTTFQATGVEFVVIVEDDLNVAPDFYEYFLGTYQLLRDDPSLWCVSAWNDNGKIGNIDESRPDLLYRTDFFPGLGWMLTRQLWTELSVKWPKAFWDDWIRQPQQRKNRVCIRPEVSRTRTFGKIGVSNGLFFEKYLRYIKLSAEYVEFSKMNLTYLLQKNYDDTYLKAVYQSPVVTFEELRRSLVTTKDPVRIQYNTKEQYKRTARLLGLMVDFKSGVPRTSYHGVVSFFYNSQRVYLAPSANWQGYDLSWS